jgi:hypoxanthine phosphoribosyltransferase
MLTSRLLKQNDLIQVADKQFEVFITENEICCEVRSLALEISEDYKGKEVIFIALLNGAFMFASDLMKEITIPVSISFAKLSSYHGGTESSGSVKELIGVGETLKDKHVVIIEDIVDTGNTIDSLLPSILTQSPASVKVCTLLFKPEAFKGINVPDYIGFSIPNAFVVGYGLDYNEYGRNLKAIYQLKK